MGALAHMREDVATVLARDPSMASTGNVVLFSTGLHAVWAHRQQHWLWEHGAHGLAVFLSQRSRRRYGVDIHPATRIGRRFMIDHGTGIVIGQTAVIGDDCLIYQGVTLGMTGKHGGKRHPTVGNNVMIGAGAIILGNITIGDEVRVAAGAVVIRDVAPHTTVAGNPARVVSDRSCPMLHLVELPQLPDYDDENVRWSCSL